MKKILFTLSIILGVTLTSFGQNHQVKAYSIIPRYNGEVVGFGVCTATKQDVGQVYIKADLISIEDLKILKEYYEWSETYDNPYFIDKILIAYKERYALSGDNDLTFNVEVVTVVPK